MKVNRNQAGAIIGSVVKIDLPRFLRPAFADTLKFPDDITQLDAQNVSELLGKYTKLLAYAAQEHAKQTVRMLEIECKMAELQSEIFIQSPGIAHIERWKRDQKIQAHPRMFNIRITLLEINQRREMLSMFVSNFERFINALSRELSRKLAQGDRRLMHSE